MEVTKLIISEIPAVLYGTDSENCFLYIHGKQGYKEEAEVFAEVVTARDCQVLSIDLPEHGERKSEKDRFNPWCVVPELRMILEYMKQHFKTISIMANSIGSWFVLQSFDGFEFEKCLFISPVLDMEKLIQNMMQWARVSEERLRVESLIITDFGETLSWQYYEYVKEHPITKWQCPTSILYGAKDNMTTLETVNCFVERFQVSLTVMKDGEHWFHTPGQLAVLNQWITEKMEELL